jgi:hypothetical protein
MLCFTGLCLVSHPYDRVEGHLEVASITDTRKLILV